MLISKRFFITKCLPDTKQKYYKVNESLYIKLLEIISEKINEEEFEYMLCTSPFDGDSILDCLGNLDEISESYECGISPNLEKILEIIENSKSKFKVQSAIMLLKNTSKIQDEALLTRLVDDLSSIDNEKKLEQIYTLLLKHRPYFSKKY